MKRNRLIEWLGLMAFMLSCVGVAALSFFVLGSLVEASGLRGTPYGIAWLVAGLAATAAPWLFARWVILRINRPTR